MKTRGATLGSAVVLPIVVVLFLVSCLCGAALGAPTAGCKKVWCSDADCFCNDDSTSPRYGQCKPQCNGDCFPAWDTCICKKRNDNCKDGFGGVDHNLCRQTGSDCECQTWP